MSKSFRVLCGCAAAAAALAAPAGAQKIPPDFRAAFEARVHRGAFAVVVQRGVPTTSIYGVDGQQQDAHYSVDVKGGHWVASEGLLDLNQVAADVLSLGEVMEVAKVSFKDKDNRIDLRMVSVEAHKVGRGQGFGRSVRREPVATNFKFFIPFPLASARDVPAAVRYVQEYLKVFRTEDEARVHGARVLAGGDSAAPRPRSRSERQPSSRSPGATPKEVKAGMTPLEVLELLGKPQKEVAFQSQSKWTYPDLTVTFENGRVKEVHF